MELFPQSKLEKQVLAGNPVFHNSIQLPVLSCAAVKTAQKNLKSLSDYIAAHEKETFMHHLERETPIGTDVRYFEIAKDGGGRTVPRMELWEQWREQNKISLGDLFGMMIACGGQTGSGSYLARCGKYVADIYGSGFENRVEVRYQDHILRIVHELIFGHISEEMIQKLAMALGIWIARCLPEEMLIGDNGHTTAEPLRDENGGTVLYYGNFQTKINYQTLNQLPGPVGHFIAHPQISRIFFKLSTAFDENLRHRIPVLLEDRADAKLIVAHPLHLYRSGNWHSFQKYLFDNKISQPFRQVFRELYVKTREELDCFTSLRYAGNQIQPKKAAACLKERRWVADIEAGLQKIYYQDNIVATIYALADWFTPADIEAPTLEYVAFYDRKTGQALKIDEIPDVVFSEVMRDVDMAVSVAHAGGVDPETSHSTIEMRAAILSFTLPLLRLKNVTVEGSHAFIVGKLASYSVHLGSGVVHQIGGTMLNVMPVHSQHRGRFFLPFVDDDPKAAEIISKVILFAEDYKLKDPSILGQISR